VFALEPRALGDAAGHVDAAAASLACLDVACPFRAAGDALPGSATLSACEWTGTGLVAAVDAFADHLVDLCETARRVAGDAVRTDEDVAERLRAGAP
jgi:hypothetical protein